MTNIRLAVFLDADALMSLDPLSGTDPQRTPFITRSISSGQCYVMECTRTVVGYGVLDYSFYDCGFVSMLYIHPEYKRKGFGSELMNEVDPIVKKGQGLS